MRVTIGTTGAALALMLMLGGCGNAEEKQAKADAKAAGFVPPAVTSRLDFGSSAERRFRALDRNGDDTITKDELPRQNARMQRLDRNSDGKITAIEWSEGMLNRFDAMDVNHDGSVTSTERLQTTGRR